MDAVPLRSITLSKSQSLYIDLVPCFLIETRFSLQLATITYRTKNANRQNVIYVFIKINAEEWGLISVFGSYSVTPSDIKSYFSVTKYGG